MTEETKSTHRIGSQLEITGVTMSCNGGAAVNICGLQLDWLPEKCSLSIKDGVAYVNGEAVDPTEWNARNPNKKDRS